MQINEKNDQNFIKLVEFMRFFWNKMFEMEKPHHL